MNKQTVYIPKATFPLNTIGIVKDLFELKTDVIIFTPEELKQLMEEYTNRIVDNVDLKERRVSYPCSSGVEYGYVTSVNKKSITSQLPEFLKEKGYE